MVSRKNNSAWLDALRRREHAAFAELLDSYQPMVAACSRRYGLREQEVEDVVSTTFLKAYQALPQYRGEASVSTWLCRIAVNQSLSVLRKAGRTWACLFDGACGVGDCDPVQQLQREELTGQLYDALKCLPARWVEAITLRYWNHMSIAQIAKVMQVSDVSVRSYLFRARNQLRVLI